MNEARTFDFDDAIVELSTGYDLSCYLIEQEGVVEISTNYSLNVHLKEKEKEIYQVYLTIFVTDQTNEILIEEFQFLKELKIQDNDLDDIIFSYNDKIQINLKLTIQVLKYFMLLIK